MLQGLILKGSHNGFIDMKHGSRGPIAIQSASPTTGCTVSAISLYLARTAAACRSNRVNLELGLTDSNLVAPGCGLTRLAGIAWQDSRYVTVDLKRWYQVGAITTWMYYQDKRRYCGQKIALSKTGKFAGEEVVVSSAL